MIGLNPGVPMTGLLKDLLGHQAWADAMFFHAWGKSASREDLELRTRTGHLVEVQEGFLGILKGETEVPEALVQVCLHTQHHRAQNMTRLKSLGVSPKNVDYIIWLWKQKPEGLWES